MQAVVQFIEGGMEFLALRRDTQAFEPVGMLTSPTQHLDIMQADPNILCVVDRPSILRFVKQMEDMEGRAEYTSWPSYYWYEYETCQLRWFGRFPNYAEACQEARRQLIIPNKGMVFDHALSRLWSMQVRDAPTKTLQ